MVHSDLLWLDSDIVLDWLAGRQPWDAAATELIERAITGEWRLAFSPLTLANTGGQPLRSPLAGQRPEST